VAFSRWAICGVQALFLRAKGYLDGATRSSACKVANRSDPHPPISCATPRPCTAWALGWIPRIGSVLLDFYARLSYATRMDTAKRYSVTWPEDGRLKCEHVEADSAPAALDVARAKYSSLGNNDVIVYPLPEDNCGVAGTLVLMQILPDSLRGDGETDEAWLARSR